jgi:hypothetical protein
LSDALEKVRIEIERDGTAKVAALFAGNAGEFLCPLPLFFGFAFGD